MTMKLRLFTSWAADRMEETLLKKDMAGYGAWEELSHEDRYNHLLKERVEVDEAVDKCLLEEQRTVEDEKRLQMELIDEALTALMLAAGFDEKLSKLKRGRRV